MKLWKIQKFFGDIVYDLRSRGLLPVVILLVVAMAAIPILITRGSSEGSTSTSLRSASGIESAPEAQTAVVSYNPGVRDYRKRLSSLSPKDPFRQQFERSAADASQLTVTNTAPVAGVPSGAPSGGSAGSGTSVSNGSSGGGTTGTGGKKKKRGSKTTYSYSVNLMAGDVNTTLTPFKNVASLTPIPSQTSPVVVYYALSQDHKQALFLVSNKVDGLSGSGTCVPAPDDCSLLSLAPGQAEDLHYAQDGKTYRVVVAEIKRVAR